jgi:hypothetical protein
VCVCVCVCVSGACVCVHARMCVHLCHQNMSSRLAYIYCHQPELLASMVCKGL